MTVVRATMVLFAASALPLPAAAGAAIRDEAGLRAALVAAADAREPVTVRLAPRTRIALTSPISVAPPVPVTVLGEGSVIDASGIAAPADGDEAGGPATLAFTTASAVLIRGLTVTGSSGRAIAVTLPEDARGEVVVTLEEVTITGAGGHGVHIDDNAAPGDDGAAGSPASLRLVLRNCRIEGAGTGGSDRDGLRVDERGEGSVAVELSRVTIAGSGGDGIEIDEAGPGGVRVVADGLTLEDNGFADPEDLEDGLDVDEADAGDIAVTLQRTRVVGSRDEGIDLDEAGRGDIRLTLVDTVVTGTRDEGVKLDEEDEGDIGLALARVLVADGKDDGVAVTEKGAGRITGRLADVRITDTLGLGLLLHQQDGGPEGRVEAGGLALSGNAKGDEPKLEGVVLGAGAGDP